MIETQVCFGGWSGLLQPHACSQLRTGGQGEGVGQSSGVLLTEGAGECWGRRAVGQESGSLGHGLAEGPWETP